MASIAEFDWTNGTLSTPSIPIDMLKPLTGEPEGNPIWKSNNPELVDGEGWLMQNERSDDQRGGSAFPLSGLFNIYLFHINRSNSLTRTLHVLIKNPNETAVTISGKGSMFTNAQHPLKGRGTGQSFHVARNWLLDTNLTSFSKTIEPGATEEIDQATLNPRNMVDGRFEVDASADVFAYTVVTSSGDRTDAINATTGFPALGDIRTPGSNRLGREAGICASSIWAGTTEIDLPASPAHIGFCLNTSNPQDQTVEYAMRLSDSALRTFGNYGHKYDVTLKLNNLSNRMRQVRLSFASSANNPNLSRTYSGPILVNDTLIDIFTTPTDPVNVIDTVAIPPNDSFSVRITFFVPGLITIPQQLILESM